LAGCGVEPDVEPFIVRKEQPLRRSNLDEGGAKAEDDEAKSERDAAGSPRPIVLPQLR
jgi:hypothetical protein